MNSRNGSVIFRYASSSEISFFHQRLDAGFPGAVEGRRHHVEGHEQREADQHQIGRRGLEAETGAQERQCHCKSREARHHDEQSRRHRQHRDHRHQLDDPAAGGAVARRQQGVEVRNLGQCHLGQHDQDQRKQQDSQFH
ncbi:hypothetical protein ACVW1A_001234 [Bradyrhizobium sp. LB1.3]